MKIISQQKQNILENFDLLPENKLEEIDLFIRFIL